MLGHFCLAELDLVANLLNKIVSHAHGPDHTTRPKVHHSGAEFQADYTQLVHSTGANVLVMVLKCCKSTPQNIKADHFRRHGVWIAIEYSYKLSQNMNLKFLCEQGCMVFAETVTYIAKHKLLFVNSNGEWQIMQLVF